MSNLINGLLNSYKCDETSGSQLHDSYGTGGIGGIIGAFNSGGKINYGLYFANATGTAYFPYSLLTSRSQAFSISFWFKYDNAGTANFTILNNISSGKGLKLLQNSISQPELTFTDGTNTLKAERSGTLYLPTTYTLCVITYDGSSTANGLNLYYNTTSKLDIKSGSNLTVDGTLGSFEMYYDAGNSSYLDEFCVWDKALTQDDVNTLYSNGNGIQLDADTIFPPFNLNVNAVSKTTISLDWDNDDNGSAVYDNIVQQYSGTTWVDVATLSKTATTYQLTGLAERVLYRLRVLAKSSTKSAASNEVYKTTIENLSSYAYVQKILYDSSYTETKFNILKIQLSTMDVVATSSTYTGIHQRNWDNGVTTSGSIILMAANKYVRKYSQIDLSYISELSIGSEIKSIISNSTHFYVFSYDGYIRKYLISDLSYVSGVAIDNTDNTIHQNIHLDYFGQYIYVATNHVYKYNLNLGLVATSAISERVWSTVTEFDNYVYASDATNGSINKFNKSNLTWVVQGDGAEHGNKVGLNVVDNSIYFTDQGARLIKYNLSSLRYVEAFGDGLNPPAQGVNLVSGNYLYTNSSRGFSPLRQTSLLKIDLNSYTLSDETPDTSTDNQFFTISIAFGLPNPINPPSGGTYSNVTCSGATLSWVNNNTIDVDGNYIQQYNGSTWVTVATVGATATSYNLSGLLPYTTYSYRIVAYNSLYTEAGSAVNFTTLDPAPFNLNATVTDQQAAFTWSINDAPYGTAIRPEIRVQGQSIWTTKPNIAKNATSYTFTGLAWSTNYEVRFVRIGSEYPSAIYSFSMPVFNTPTNLITTSIGDKVICLSWQVNSLNDDQTIWVKKENGAWVLYQTVSNITNTICVSGLSMQTEYTFNVCNNFGSYTLCSNQFQATTTISFLPPFCEGGGQYNITGSTCGNSIGIIQLNDPDYTIFYDFYLTDIQGNSYTLSNCCWSGLTASWYKLTAIPKQQWWVHYGAEPCILDWIPLEDSNTSISLTDVKIKTAICGGFGNSNGRIIYNMTDSNGTGWTFNLYTENYELVNTQILTDISAIVYLCRPNIYYGIVENNHGCTYLLDLTEVLSEKLYSVDGIQKLYLTPWTNTMGYNYYDNTSEDWYQSGIDTQQFTSSKISEFFNLSDYWYEIKLDTARMNYLQNLTKSQNGLMYQEVVEISIPSADNAKWQQLKTLLSQRYVIVFQDNNDYYWTCFYRSGAEVKAYGLSENQYKITFSYPATKAMLTSIDYAYVKLHIL